GRGGGQTMRLSAVALPGLAAAARLAGLEHDAIADRGQKGRERAVLARIDVGDERRAGCAAVALPQLGTVLAVVSREEQLVAQGREGEEKGEGAERAAAGTEVGDHLRAVRAAVAAPQLGTVHTIVGDEEQRTADVAQERRRRIRMTRIEIAHLDGARFRTVALPQLHAADAIVGGEVQRL